MPPKRRHPSQALALEQVPGIAAEAGGVTVLWPLSLPSTVPADASQMFSRNVLTLVRHLAPQGRLTIDLNDEITGAMALVHGGEVRHRA